MKLIYRKVTPDEVKKAQRRCKVIRLIFFKIPLWLWIAVLVLLFILSKFSLILLLVVAVYPGVGVWFWLILAHILTKDWQYFL